MSIRLALALAALGVSVASSARADDCAKNAAGQLYATGSANAAPKADSPGLRRVGAERAATLDALAKLEKCLGDKAKTMTGFTLSEVRYFDSDPIVEIDLAAAFDGGDKLTVLGTALPGTKDLAAAGRDAKQARLTTQRAAQQIATRNAAEAFKKAFPEATGAEGELHKALAGSIGACSTDEITYWDDLAVTVKVTCGKGVDTSGKPVDPKDAAKLQKHEAPKK